MALFSKEHYELMAQFEQLFKHRRLDREAKDLWSKSAVYQDGQVNDLFIAYRQGVALGQALARAE